MPSIKTKNLQIMGFRFQRKWGENIFINNHRNQSQLKTFSKHLWLPLTSFIKDKKTKAKTPTKTKTHTNRNKILLNKNSDLANDWWNNPQIPSPNF